MLVLRTLNEKSQVDEIIIILRSKLTNDKYIVTSDPSGRYNSNLSICTQIKSKIPPGKYAVFFSYFNYRGHSQTIT